MKPAPIIFTGSSLPAKKAAELLPGSIILPPAKRGDIFDRLKKEIKNIILIDGELYQNSAVGHLEILHALRGGVQIVGCSSIGALRAVEMAKFGMKGIGYIYQNFYLGKIIGDDEVALIFNPDTFKPLSLPLIQVRYSLSLALEKKLVTRQEAAKILKYSREIFFMERSWKRVINEVLINLVTDRQRLNRLIDFLPKVEDIKEKDAIAALNYFKGLQHRIG